MRKIISLGLLFAAFVSFSSFADEASVTKRFKEKFPKLGEVSAARVTEGGVDGLYSVIVNGRVAYVDEKVTFVLTNGNLLSSSSAENLTMIHQMKANRQLFTSLPKDKAFKTVFGKGERQLITIEDADCPACQEFTKLLHAHPKPSDLNLTLYTFPFALERLHPDAARKGDLLWCSSTSPDKRSAAWKTWMTKAQLPTAKVPGCVSPLAENLKRFKGMDINATPTLIFEDGTSIPGGMRVPELVQVLDEIGKEMKKLRK